MIIRKPVAVHSRARTRKNAEARRKGRHSGYGKRKGTANARMPEKVCRTFYVFLLTCQNSREQKKLIISFFIFIFFDLKFQKMTDPLDTSYESLEKTFEEIQRGQKDRQAFVRINKSLLFFPLFCCCLSLYINLFIKIWLGIVTCTWSAKVTASQTSADLW